MLVFGLLLITSLFIVSGWLMPLQAQIVDTTNPGYAQGDYKFNDFILIAIRVSRIVLGLVGSLALLMFIYGGFMFLISAGSSESVSKARKIIVAAVVGLIIVFASFLIIKFVLQSMGINWNGEMIKIPTK